jgi:hypothetical protein
MESAHPPFPFLRVKCPYTAVHSDDIDSKRNGGEGSVSQAEAGVV